MDISIIIVNYNTKEMTVRCVEAFLYNRQDDYDIEIILVDNSSIDGSKEYFYQKYSNNKRVKLIFNDNNYGFGIANNIGAEIATGKYIAFVNSDTYIKHFNFKNLINCFEKCKNIGALSCKILYPNGLIQTIGYNYPSLWNDFKLNVLFWNYKFVKNYRYKKYVNKGLIKKDWVSGCFFMCEKHEFLKIKGFDSQIFMYAEDLDICIRFSDIGKKNYVYDKEKIYHLHGQSSKKSKPSLKNMFISKRNYYYVLKKNKITKWPKLIYTMNIIHVIFLFIFIYIRQQIFARRRTE